MPGVTGPTQLDMCTRRDTSTVGTMEAQGVRGRWAGRMMRAQGRVAAEGMPRRTGGGEDREGPRERRWDHAWAGGSLVRTRSREREGDGAVAAARCLHTEKHPLFCPPAAHPAARRPRRQTSGRPCRGDPLYRDAPLHRYCNCALFSPLSLPEAIRSWSARPVPAPAHPHLPLVDLYLDTAAV